MQSFILCALVGVLIGYIVVVAETGFSLNPVNLGSSSGPRVSVTFFAAAAVFTTVCYAISGLMGGLASLFGFAIVGAYWLRKLS